MLFGALHRGPICSREELMLYVMLHWPSLGRLSLSEGALHSGLIFRRSFLSPATDDLVQSVTPNRKRALYTA